MNGNSLYQENVDFVDDTGLVLDNSDEVQDCWQHLVNLDSAFDRRTQAMLTAESFLLTSLAILVANTQFGAMSLILRVCVCGLGLLISLVWLRIQERILSQIDVLRKAIMKHTTGYYPKMYRNRPKGKSVMLTLGQYLPRVFLCFWVLLGLVSLFCWRTASN